MARSLPLGLIRDPKNEELLAWLAKLEAYDFSNISEDVQRKYAWSASKSNEIEIQVKQFMSLAVLDQGFYHIPDINVDEYWHRMILHTQWYSQFCSDMFGSYYHHTPEPDPELVNKENRERSIRVVDHWFGLEWRHLVETCTQCKGPVPPGLDSLTPHSSVLPPQ